MEAEAVFLFTLEAAVEAMKMSGSGDIFLDIKIKDKLGLLFFYNFALHFFFLLFALYVFYSVFLSIPLFPFWAAAPKGSLTYVLTT